MDTTSTVTGTDIAWETNTDVKYAITFTCDLGSTTKYLTKGTTITVPTEYSNYDWAPKFTTGDKVTGNANYVGTPKAST